MSKLCRSMTICSISVAFATLSIASAQQFTTIDFPGAAQTTLNGGPNPEGTIIGSYTDTSNFTHGFQLKKGVFTPFDPPGSFGTIPNMINPQGVIVGYYVDATGLAHGFVFENGGYETVDFPGGTQTVLSGINPSGAISGYVCTAPCYTTHSFLRSKQGTFTSFDPPGAISSNTAIVTPSGVVFGGYTDSAGTGHGYRLDHGVFTTIDFPGAIFTLVGGANAEGDCVGEYVDMADVGHSFLLSKGVFTSVDPPGAVGFSVGAGINPSRVIVGFYGDSANNSHGYIRTP